MPPATVSPSHKPGRQRRLIADAFLGILVFAVYLSNGREIGSYDTIPTNLTAYTLSRGQGLALDRFDRLLRESDGRRSPYVAESGGHLVSRYPLATAVMAVPVFVVLGLYEDIVSPGWDRSPPRAWVSAQEFGKVAGALLTALAAVAIVRLLRAIELDRMAVVTGLFVALGSDLWTVASQSLWQHGPAALLLAVALGLLARIGCRQGDGVPQGTSPERKARPPDETGDVQGERLAVPVLRGCEIGRARALVAGVAAGGLVAVRSLDAVLVAGLVVGLAIGQPRRLGWFLPGVLALGGLTLAYNLQVFGTPSGGQAALEAMHPEVHGKPAGVLSGDLLEGLAGTLVSPARGLFVYCPWVLVALLALPWSARRHVGRPVLWWALGALVPYLLLLAKYPVWWAGHAFGPRYWTDAMPLFAVVLALAIEHGMQRTRWLLPALGCGAAWAILLQAVGAYCYPSSWNLSPTNVDRDHSRLWDWSDTEVRRCLREARERRGR